MAKRRTKKAISQRVVSTATMGMPGPVRSVLGGRLGSRLVILVVISLFATGIASVDWTGGRPHLEINRQRAEQVGHEAYERAEKVAERVHEEREPDRWGLQRRH